MRRSRIFIALLMFCCNLQPAKAQDSLLNEYIDINKVYLSCPISSYSAVSFAPSESDLIKSYNFLQFRASAPYRTLIKAEDVTKHFILRFNITNNSDSTRSVWLLPGLYFWDACIYRDKNGVLDALPKILPNGKNEISYRKITLESHDSATIVADLELVRTHLNSLRPQLISEPYLQPFMTTMDNTNVSSKIVTYLLCGLFLMMVLFSLASFFQGSSHEFLYYSGYAFMLGLMLFIKAIYSFSTSSFGFFQEGYLDFMMQCSGTIFYALFMQKFLSAKRRHPFLHKLYNTVIALLIIAMLLFSYAHFFTNNFSFENGVENYTKIALLCFILVFLVYSLIRWDDQLLHYLFWGNLSLFVFSLLSFLLITNDVMPRSLPYIFRNALFYYELGLLFELIFFLMGLNYKNRRQIVSQARERERLKAANQMNEYEKEIAVYKAQQQERERISADMHDELGSGMTAIRLMSEIARNKMKENTPVEIEKISSSADEVLNKMNAIIWSMNSGNDTVDNLVSYIRAYALEYFEYTNIECRIFTPENIVAKELTGDKRRNLFLCVKESLNNVLKHSKATEVRIYFTIDLMLMIKIIDNGVGIDKEKIRQFGNGLKNINKRMESIGGTYNIEKKEGTVTTIKLNLV